MHSVPSLELMRWAWAERKSALREKGTGSCAAHMFANTPMQKLVRAEMAAVAVTRSLWTPCTHRRYSESVSQRSGLSAGQTQVPPDRDVMEALTEMM